MVHTGPAGAFIQVSGYHMTSHHIKMTGRISKGDSMHHMRFSRKQDDVYTADRKKQGDGILGLCKEALWRTWLLSIIYLHVPSTSSH